MVYVLTIFLINLLKDPPWFLSKEQEIVEICKFPKLDQNMQREVFTSRVSKTGMIFLAASENKIHSLVSKRDLEITFRTCKAQTRTLGREQFYSICFPFFFGYRNYIFFFLFPFKSCWKNIRVKILIENWKKIEKKLALLFYVALDNKIVFQYS